jgi:hypothetical protein
MSFALLPFAALAAVSALPPLNTRVAITPTNSLGTGVRHCSFQLSTTDTDEGNDDFSFRLVAGLNGVAGDVSFQSVNYDDHYICPQASLKGYVGIGEIGVACADNLDASWHALPGLADASNSSFTSSSSNAAFSGLYLTRNNSATCICCDVSGGWKDIILATAGAGLSQTFLVGSPPPPPPPPPAVLVVHAGTIDHRISKKFLGCHSDPGYTQEPLGWTADLVYGNAFQASPSSKISAWNDVTSVQGSCRLDDAHHVNPSVATPSLGCTFTSGSGLAAWSNRGIGNEGLFFEGEKDYEGFVVVLAVTPATLYVGLNNRDTNTSLASVGIPVTASPSWQVINFTLSTSDAAVCYGIPPGSDPTIDCGRMGPNPGHVCVRCQGEFVVGLSSPGQINIGYSTVMPGSWGRLQDLPVLKRTMDTMQEMGITMIRQGGTVSQSFAWKEWRGAPWLRPSMGHQWGDSLVGSWGMFEFIDMCNAADIEPVVTLAYDMNKAADWADLIEYLYGNSSTTWGALRITDGHPAPYIIDTFELGNEQENPSFVEQVKAIEARRVRGEAKALARLACATIA